MGNVLIYGEHSHGTMPKATGVAVSAGKQIAARTGGMYENGIEPAGTRPAPAPSSLGGAAPSFERVCDPGLSKNSLRFFDIPDRDVPFGASDG